jgi:hypothetical protein
LRSQSSASETALKATSNSAGIAIFMRVMRKRAGVEMLTNSDLDYNEILLMILH